MILTAGDVMLDCRVLTGPSGSIKLSKTEAAILTALMRKPNVTVAHDRIFAAMYETPDHECECPERCLKVFVVKLRAKLAQVGAPRAIESVWGTGYRFAAGPTLHTRLLTDAEVGPVDALLAQLRAAAGAVAA